MRVLLLIHFLVFNVFAIVDIASVDFLEKEEGLSGSAYGSFQKKRGNTDRDESEYGGRIQFDTKTTITWLQGEIEHDESGDTTTDDNAFMHLRHIHQIFNPSWALEFYGQLKKDKFKNLQQRKLMGMGPRVKLADSKEYGKLFFGLSLMDERVNYTQDTVDADEHNLRLSSSLSYKIGVDDNLDFSLLGYYQPKLDEGSDYLATSLAELTMHLTKVIDLSYLVEFDYDSRPPSSIEKTDLRQKLSFVYRFGEDEPLGAYADEYLKPNKDAEVEIKNRKATDKSDLTAGTWRFEDETLTFFQDGSGSYRDEASPYEEKIRWRRLGEQKDGAKAISVHHIDEEKRFGRIEYYLFGEGNLVGVSADTVKVFKR